MPGALALFGNIGIPEMVMIVVVAVLIFGGDLPQAASKAYVQLRKLRNAVDDLRRDSGIDQEIRNLQRTVREAEWEARRMDGGDEVAARKLTPAAPVSRVPRPPPGSAEAAAGLVETPPAVAAEAETPNAPPAAPEAPAREAERATDDAAS